MYIYLFHNLHYLKKSLIVSIRALIAINTIKYELNNCENVAAIIKYDITPGATNDNGIKLYVTKNVNNSMITVKMVKICKKIITNFRCCP